MYFTTTIQMKRTTSNYPISPLQSCFENVFKNYKLKITATFPRSQSLTHWGLDKMAAIFQCIFLNDNI